MSFLEMLSHLKRFPKLFYQLDNFSFQLFVDIFYAEYV